MNKETFELLSAYTSIVNELNESSLPIEVKILITAAEATISKASDKLDNPEKYLTNEAELFFIMKSAEILDAAIKYYKE